MRLRHVHQNQGGFPSLFAYLYFPIFLLRAHVVGEKLAVGISSLTRFFYSVKEITVHAELQSENSEKSSLFLQETYTDQPPSLWAFTWLSPSDGGPQSRAPPHKGRAADSTSRVPCIPTSVAALFTTGKSRCNPVPTSRWPQVKWALSVQGHTTQHRKGSACCCKAVTQAILKDPCSVK